jgi:hypothetical protein
LTAIPAGLCLTDTVAATVFVDVLITDTFSLLEFLIYASTVSHIFIETFADAVV